MPREKRKKEKGREKKQRLLSNNTGAAAACFHCPQQHEYYPSAANQAGRVYRRTEARFEPLRGGCELGGTPNDESIRRRPQNCRRCCHARKHHACGVSWGAHEAVATKPTHVGIVRGTHTPCVHRNRDPRGVRKAKRGTVAICAKRSWLLKLEGEGGKTSPVGCTPGTKDGILFENHLSNGS